MSKRDKLNLAVGIFFLILCITCGVIAIINIINNDTEMLCVNFIAVALCGYTAAMRFFDIAK